MNQYAKKANATGNIYLEDVNSMKAKDDELIQLYGKVLHRFNKIGDAIEYEYYVAAEPPVRCGESHLSGQTEPPCYYCTMF